MLLTESVLLFLAGGTAGTLLAVWATRTVAGVQLPVPMPFAFDFTPDLRVLAFALLTAFVTGTLFGLAPALQSAKADVATALRDERGAVSGRRIRLRNAFVVVQVAGSAVLLVVGSLFLRTLGRAESVDLGFNPHGVHVLSLDLSVHHYSREEGQQLVSDLVERSQALAGVQAAAVTSLLPLGFDWGSQTYTIPGREPVRGEGLVQADFNSVSPGYFETMDIPVLTGRVFEPTDRAGSPPVVVVNETAARSFWPGEQAVGKILEQGETRYEVVGVVRDSKSHSIWAPLEPAAYKAYAQSHFDIASIVLRVPASRQGIAAELREIVRMLDPDLPVRTNGPYSQIIGLSLLPSRIGASVAGAFGALGVILAAVGLFGVLSYAVTQRTREIGIRLALGADIGDVRRLILVGGVRLTLGGLAIGLALAFGGAQLLRGMVYGLSPADPVAFGAIALLVIAVGSLASYLPARRATRTDPMEALRYDG
jgi:predicted permease